MSVKSWICIFLSTTCATFWMDSNSVPHRRVVIRGKINMASEVYCCLLAVVFYPDGHASSSCRPVRYWGAPTSAPPRRIFSRPVSRSRSTSSSWTRRTHRSEVTRRRHRSSFHWSRSFRRGWVKPRGWVVWVQAAVSSHVVQRHTLCSNHA